MTDKPPPRPRGRPPKPIPKLNVSPERAGAAQSSPPSKKPDPTIRVQKTHTRKPKATQ